MDTTILPMDADRLDDVFAALADPTRRALLHRLAGGDASVTELTEPFAMSQPAISRHLKVLERAGLISRSRVATARYSHLEAVPLRQATEYLERYRHFWNSSFDRLDTALAEFQTEASHHADPRRQTDPKHQTESKRQTEPNRKRESKDE